MNHGSLFSGIGGPDLAAEWMGWENIFHCEWNTFGQRVLKYYWPQAKSYEDITKTDFTIHRGTIDVLTGGFPCQPYSLAGKRKGKDDERHLWPEMLRAIREIQPRWVVGENVLGLVNWNGGMVFDEVQSDLEAQGYEVWPYVLPACAKNAPHRRDRVWFVAYSDSGGRYEGYKCKYDNNGERQICKDFKNNRDKVWSEFGSGCNDGPTPDTDSSPAGTPGESTSLKRSRSRNNDEPKERGEQAEQHTGRNEFLRATPNPQSKPSKRMQPKQSKPCEQKQGESGGNCGEMGNGGIVTDPGNQGLQGSEINGSITGSRAFRNKQPSRLLPPDWQNFPTQSPVCNGNDGISSRLDGITFSKWRNESIKAGGNAIVPQVIFEIFKAIEQYEKPNTIRTIRRTAG